MATVADTVTKTIVAVVSLIAAVLVVVGLGRAWAGRRRSQVVIEDVVALEGFPVSVVAGLSPLLRQEVRRSLEFATLGSAPDAVTTFWAPVSMGGTVDDRAAAVRNTLHDLIEPAALWIAIRLVAQYLSDTSGRTRSGKSRFGPERGASTGRPGLRRARSRTPLSGLRAQLTGQMSLYATRDNQRFDLNFADQALEDLADAARLLPGYFRPHSTQAAVQERVGWSHRRAGRTTPASKAFRDAVRAYGQADELLGELAGRADGVVLNRTRQAIFVRRTKSRLLAGDAAQTVVAVRELTEFSEPLPSTTINLYNAACLLAVALTVGAGSAQQRLGWERLGWQLLGRSLLVGGGDGPWNLMLADVELEYLDQPTRVRFAEQLKERRPEMTGIPDDEARLVVDEVLEDLAVPLPPARESGLRDSGPPG